MIRQNDALPIKDIVNKVISDISTSETKERRISEEDIGRLWRKAAGKLASQGSRPTSLRKGKLVVLVDNSSLLYNLTIRKKAIFEVLHRELDDRIRDIQFRIGAIGEKGKEEGRK
jgi:hypothetical protein